jgi:hypothetical protein
MKANDSNLARAYLELERELAEAKASYEAEEYNHSLTKDELKASEAALARLRATPATTGDHEAAAKEIFHFPDDKNDRLPTSAEIAAILAKHFPGDGKDKERLDWLLGLAYRFDTREQVRAKELKPVSLLFITKHYEKPSGCDRAAIDAARQN